MALKERVHLQDNKSHQLKLCNVFFPPDRLLQLWPESGKKIIKIHESMNEQINETEKNSMPAWDPSSCYESSQNHEEVMIAMQKREMRVLLL